LNHTGIVKVLDYGIEEKRPFVVMEMIEESTLDEMLKQGKKMKPLGALYFANEIGNILSYLHSQGLSHGSLDEWHIFIFPGRKAKISDPGFPTILGGGDRPFPMSLDSQQDLRDLGYLLYRCLTGKSKEAAAEDIRNGELQWEQEVPARLRRLVEMCIGDSGKGGFASVDQMMREIVSTLREEQPMAPLPRPESEEQAKEAEAAVPLKLPRMKRWQVWLGAAVLAVAAIMIVFWVISVFIGQSKVEVPNLVDVSVEEAVKVADDLDLGLMVVGEEYDAAVKAEHIISQEPKGGEMVKRKTLIKVLKSLGPLTVPNLIGISLEDARMVLESRGFRVGEIVYRDAPGYREDIVVETDPSYGSKLSGGDAVNLVVSKGASDS
jgi:serine/threonine-protein kinase